MENMTSLATMLLNTSSAYLYIVDVKCIGDNTDDANMKSLVKRDKRERYRYIYMLFIS